MKRSGSLRLLVPTIILLILSLTIKETSQVDPTTTTSNPRGREGRGVHEIFLSDPLDCLSQLICGLNTYPPQVPSARSTTSNDFAYLLQHVIIRLKKQKQVSTTTTSTTPSPTNLNEEDEESQDDDAEDSEEGDSMREYLLKNSRDQEGDLVEMKGLYPPFGLIDYSRDGRSMKKERPTKGGMKDKRKSAGKISRAPPPTKPPTQLQLLQREQDIRSKLRSGAKCMYGILEHSCPFLYSELLILMSGVLERQNVISHSSNRILPMVGYLLKSRSLTQTLKASFFALERINNVTLTRHKAKLPFSFPYVYDDIARGQYAGNGLHIVETRNDPTAASSSLEDDELDAALATPFLSRNKIPGYAIKNRNKKKKQGEEEEEEDEGDDVEAEGVIPPPNASPFIIGDIANFPTLSEEDEEDEEKSTEQDVPLPPVYGAAAGRHGLKKRKHRSI